ncbi:MAG TPA: septum formation inhibitor Maf [Candidatus Acutalibacter pullicola]|uniref:Nucleoside triphosphate pyrophosphatase n=1 Tax=Candidatus Acutalibacter pullicola TaxID=2838417 RepID=A0A9D2MXL4_9FIRM|nr:septum formation inhibitor Maf [Candidatus Acutalibacter pullicola]
MALKIDRELVLASSSPSRKMLLEQAGVSFEVVVSGVDETVPASLSPAQTVELLAERKGKAVLPLRPDKPIIAADSVVSIDGLILGKPKDDQEAKATLRRLSGRTHQIFTGVCLLANGREEVFHQSTKVTFYPLTEEEIADYVALGESQGRAGAYGIEGIGVVLVQSIEGDYSNIVGLPVAETLRRLRKLLQA